MEEEFGLHLELETDRLVREAGLAPNEARRQALVAFGGVERHKEELREGRGLAWLGGLSLDFKLGLRMMAKSPGLTVVAVVGMAVAVAICAASFGALSVFVDGTLPLPEGDRIVAIRNIDTRTSDEAYGSYLHDLATWRASVSAVQDFGAYRTIDRNLITRGGRPESVRIAEMTASGFRITRVPPLKGRYFNAADERQGAPPVVAIGYTVWQNRFAGRPDIVGQMLQLGDTRYTIVGVMPRGYAFPINNRIWIPLRLDPSRYERGDAPALVVFGRLAPAATLHDAQTQLNAIDARLAATYPESHQYIRSRVLPYARAFLDSPQVAWLLRVAQLLVGLLLVVIGTNVAVLVYARTATRTSEIAVRSALGASRARIVTQLFAEALVLSAVAAAVGMVGARVILHQFSAFIARQGGEQFPFWWHFGISLTVLLYIAGLAVLAAGIIGVLPALKATARDAQTNLQQLGTGGSGMRLGRTWTVLIVAQVAIAVMGPTLVIGGLREWMRLEFHKPAIATTHFLMARLVLDEQELQGQRLGAERPVAGTRVTPGATHSDLEAHDAAFAARFVRLRTELARRLEAEPGIADVVFASASPGSENGVRMEVDTMAAAPRPAMAPDGRALAVPLSTSATVLVNRVSLGYLRAFDVPVLAGRTFQRGDFSHTSTAVLVNRSFVQKMLGGGNPLGRRVRAVAGKGDATSARAPSEPWAEIVGVVADFPNPDDPAHPPKLYRPLLPTDARPVMLAIRVRSGSPASFAGRLRGITVAVNPMLRLGKVAALEEMLSQNTWPDRLMILAVVLLALTATLLSAAGIYALMSFTITRRRREIGVRLALGGQPRRILASVLARAAGQVAIGIVIGAGLLALMNLSPIDGAWGVRKALLSVPVVAGPMMAVALLAAIGPARRALRIQPTEALKAE
jgi:hypothetical protein